MYKVFKIILDNLSYEMAAKFPATGLQIDEAVHHHPDDDQGHQGQGHQEDAPQGHCQGISTLWKDLLIPL